MSYRQGFPVRVFNYGCLGLFQLKTSYPICVDSVRKQWPTATISEATSVLHKGLQVALASTSSASSAENRPRSPEVVLSLGPYGATTKPGAEYSGLYTPPYGLGDINSPQPCTNAFTHDESPEARASEEALLAFHLERLRVYVRCKEWKEIAWIGFETIPLLREVRAIRRAMAKVDSELEEQGRGGEKKPFWICGTFPGGEFPQVILNTHGDGTVEGRATVEEVVHTMMSRCVHFALLDVIAQDVIDQKRSRSGSSRRNRPQLHQPRLPPLPNSSIHSGISIHHHQSRGR